MISKFRNSLKMFSRLSFGSMLRFYKLKYFTGKENKNHKIFLKSGIALNVNKNEGDLTTLYEVFVDEDYNFGNTANRNINILDIGANVGYFSMYIANKYPESKVFSFEPFPETFSKLNNHLTQNNFKNIYTFNLAVSDMEGTSKFYSFEWSGCNTLVDGKFDEGLHKVTNVKCVKFDMIPEVTGAGEFEFAKVDCEGSEYPIFLNSSERMIRSVKKYIIEIHDSQKFNKQEILNRFEKTGYKSELKNNILTAVRID